jgi:hypothetical protein
MEQQYKPDVTDLFKGASSNSTVPRPPPEQAPEKATTDSPKQVAKQRKRKQKSKKNLHKDKFYELLVCQMIVIRGSGPARSVIAKMTVDELLDELNKVFGIELSSTIPQLKND